MTPKSPAAKRKRKAEPLLHFKAYYCDPKTNQIVEIWSFKAETFAAARFEFFRTVPEKQWLNTFFQEVNPPLNGKRVA